MRQQASGTSKGGTPNSLMKMAKPPTYKKVKPKGPKGGVGSGAGRGTAANKPPKKGR